MKIINEIIKNSNDYQEWKVPSNTSKGKTYIVTLSSGRWGCECYAGSIGKKCKHVKYVEYYAKTRI